MVQATIKNPTISGIFCSICSAHNGVKLSFGTDILILRSFSQAGEFSPIEDLGQVIIFGFPPLLHVCLSNYAPEIL